ncbi:MAG: hypothetical protein RLZZ609_715 [Cyanobacteriota bacterium]|jgi:hypothetical protein
MVGPLGPGANTRIIEGSARVVGVAGVAPGGEAAQATCRSLGVARGGRPAGPGELLCQCRWNDGLPPWICWPARVEVTLYEGHAAVPLHLYAILNLSERLKEVMANSGNHGGSPQRAAKSDR